MLVETDNYQSPEEKPNYMVNRQDVEKFILKNQLLNGFRPRMVIDIQKIVDETKDGPNQKSTNKHSFDISRFSY